MENPQINGINPWVAVSGFNGLNSITTRLTYFKSADDEGRITFCLGLGFSSLLRLFHKQNHLSFSLSSAINSVELSLKQMASF
jgi:hypothetical protein